MRDNFSPSNRFFSWLTERAWLWNVSAVVVWGNFCSTSMLAARLFFKKSPTYFSVLLLACHAFPFWRRKYYVTNTGSVFMPDIVSGKSIASTAPDQNAKIYFPRFSRKFNERQKQCVSQRLPYFPIPLWFKISFCYLGHYFFLFTIVFHL